MNKLTYFVLMCLFSATVYANDPAHETVMPRQSVVVSKRANHQLRAAISKSQTEVRPENLVYKARIDKVKGPGHILITDAEKLGHGNVADEYIVHGVWQHN